MFYLMQLSAAKVINYRWQKKQSHYSPGQALRVPGCCLSQISRQSAHECGKVFSPTHRPPLPQEIFLVLIGVRGWVDPRAIMRREGLCQFKIPLIPSRIEPANFQLVAQWLSIVAEWNTGHGMILAVGKRNTRRGGGWYPSYWCIVHHKFFKDWPGITAVLVHWESTEAFRDLYSLTQQHNLNYKSWNAPHAGTPRKHWQCPLRLKACIYALRIQWWRKWKK